MRGDNIALKTLAIASNLWYSNARPTWKERWWIEMYQPPSYRMLLMRYVQEKRLASDSNFCQTARSLYLRNLQGAHRNGEDIVLGCTLISAHAYSEVTRLQSRQINLEVFNSRLEQHLVQVAEFLGRICYGTRLFSLNSLAEKPVGSKDEAITVYYLELRKALETLAKGNDSDAAGD